MKPDVLGIFDPSSDVFLAERVEFDVVCAGDRVEVAEE